MKEAISPAEAAALIPDGATLLIGGFMGVGSPHRLIEALGNASTTRSPVGAPRQRAQRAAATNNINCRASVCPVAWSCSC